MVSYCLKNDSAFGVCLIQNGKEAGLAAEPHRIGTLARIIDWDRLPEGLLGIVVLGSHRFAIESIETGNNQLVSGTVKVLPEPTLKDLPSELNILPRLLEQIITEAGSLYDSIDHKFDDTNWIGYRLAEILPLDPPVRQRLLEIDDSLERLRQIRASIEVYLDRDPDE